MQNNTLLRSLPKVDKFIEHQDFQNLSRIVILPILRDTLEALRNDILADKISEVNHDDLRQNILEQYNKIMTPSLTKSHQCHRCHCPYQSGEKSHQP